jgi:hypothetical protein
LFFHNYLIFKLYFALLLNGDWGLGIGDWGFGVWVFGFGVWGLGPNPKSPIPNPQSPIPLISIKFFLYQNIFK